MYTSALRILALALALHTVEARNDLTSRSRHRGHAASKLSARKTYSVADWYEGQAFLDSWNFYSNSDPTNGMVNYQSKEDAVSKNLAYVQDDGTFVMTVDDSTWLSSGSYRDSVRISSQKSYNQGLFIADIYVMPHGCSVWPAWWSVGPNWPSGGEIDVLEGVHDQSTNQYTLHTSTGCTTTTTDKVSAALSTTQCAVAGADNTGCAYIDSDTSTYGAGFNLIGGGVYAHLWDADGIKIWHFPRTAIPADITSKAPNPDSWGTPAAFWSSSSCDVSNHFYDHTLTFDITLCGDWAGATYSSAGCPGTCADRVADPTNFQTAKWKLNYVAVYQ